MSIKILFSAGRIFFASAIFWLLLAETAAAQNFWNPSNGPTQNQVRALAVNADDYIFAGHYDAGIYRSIDTASTWSAINTGLVELRTRALAVHPNNWIFAGTEDGVYRSENDGDSWSKAHTGITNNVILTFAVNPAGDIFTGTLRRGAYRSTNNGNSWERVINGLGSDSVSVLAIKPAGGIFAGTIGHGIFFSSNNGDSWQARNIGIANTEVRAIAFNASGFVFVGTVGIPGVTNGGIYRSTNNGASWTAMNDGLTSLNVYALAVNSLGHIFAGTAGGGVFLSTNNGNTWKSVNDGLTSLDVRALALNAGEFLFAGTLNRGVFKSAESTTDAGSAPFATTDPATNISTTSATLNGTGNPNNLSTDVKFEYGLTTSYSNEINATPSPINGDSAVAVSTLLETLTPNTLYHYRVVGLNSVGTTNGLDQTFTTAIDGSAPTVITDAATNISTTTATLNGTVNPNNLSTDVKFEYGLTASYGSEIVASQNPITGTSNISVSASLADLTPNTLYHYRVVGSNIQGMTNGLDQTFTTAIDGSAPTVITDAATNISTTTATLNGTVNPNNLSTDVKFEYGLTASYGSEIVASQSPITGTSNVLVSTSLADLTPNTLYHYRVVGSNIQGTTNGSDQTFTTAIDGSAPTVITDAATNISTTTATLNGTVNPNNLSTDVKFEYGLTASYGSEIVASQSPITGTSNVLVSASLADLTPNTLYHYRVVGSNIQGTTNGSDQTFTTAIDGSAPTVITQATTNISTTTATLNGTVNPNNLSTDVKFEYGLTASYGSEVVASQSPITGTINVSVNAILAALTPNTLYHYRAVAINDAGTSNGADRTFSTSANQPPLVTPPNPPAPLSGQEVVITATITDDESVASVVLNYRKAGDPSFITTLMTATAGQYSGAISPSAVTSRGIEYFIIATDSRNLSSRLPAMGIFSIQVRVNNETKTAVQPGSTAQTAYRLFSVPIDLDDESAGAVLEDDLGAYDRSKWRLYGLNNGQLPYVEFPSAGNFTPGRSFFLIIAPPDKLIDAGAGQSIRTDRPFEITLAPGHNFVASPFNFSIPAGKLRVAGGGNIVLRTFNGEWIPADAMAPWEGYYLANTSTTAQTLSVDPSLFPASSSAEFSDQSSDQGSVSRFEFNDAKQGHDWRIQIIVRCGEARDAYNFAGANSASIDGWDDFDASSRRRSENMFQHIFPIRNGTTC